MEMAWSTHGTRFRGFITGVVLLLLASATAPASGQPSPPAGGLIAGDSESASSRQEPGRRVLLLYSEARLTPSVVALDQALRSTLESHSPVPMYFQTEFLDLNTSNAASFQDGLHELLRRKYQRRSVDLIVAQGQLTVPYALQFRAELFRGVPVVFAAVEASTFAAFPVESGVTGTWRERGFKQTLDLARRLHPDTRRAAVVVGLDTG